MFYVELGLLSIKWYENQCFNPHSFLGYFDVKSAHFIFTWTLIGRLLNINIDIKT